MCRLNLNNIQLQQLQIPTGWNVVWNQFYDIDPDSNIKVEGLPNEDIWELFVQDLLQLENPHYNLILDLGWIPEADPNGSFELTLIKNEDWLHPIATYKSNKKDEIVKQINSWLSQNYT